jgi:excinuclease ABC subunit A
MRRADYIVDLGPGAGHQGGRVVAAGTPAEVARSAGLTGQYLRGQLRIPVPERRRVATAHVELTGLTRNNLKNIDAAFPLASFCAVTGVSGSGKSTLVLDSLLPALKSGRALPRGFKDAQVIVVDQSAIGSTPASNPATYTGVFTPLRELYAQLPVSKVKGFGPGRFSFNMRGGRCEACEGKGQLRVEMHFLADVWVTCEVCRGQRYNAETLGVELRGRNIAQVLAMEVGEALDLFANHPKIKRPLKAMVDVGLGYLRLGQPGNTLSGGEAQRIKLVAQLARPGRRHNIYLLDEPTTGLHLQDVARLVQVLHRLVDAGHTVIVIEHHLDVIKNADQVIELGPGAGPLGGEVLVQGTPEAVAACALSATGQFLAPLLGDRPAARPDRRAEEAAG